MALHVDYEIRWKNYRAFEDTDWITTRPLTILIGPNNSGKTSILSPLLLMNQTMSSRDAVTPLVTRGPLIDAGMFKDIVHNYDISKKLFLGLRYHVHQKKTRLGKVGTYPPGVAEITLAAGEQPADIVLQCFELFDVHKRHFFSQSRTPNGNYVFESEALKSLKPKEVEAISKNHPINFLFSPAAALHTFLETSSKEEMAPSSDYSKSFRMYVSALSIAFEELRDLFRNLSYIGPLRERPKRYYEVASEMPVSVGSRGEHMANLLRRRMGEFRQELNTWIKR